MKSLRIIILAIFFPLSITADEGMWILPLLEELNIGTMTEMGLKLSAEDIYSLNNSSLKDAIVRFGGGCTGEIISDQGLLLTNHHCGYGKIQSHSTTEHNYLEDGFWAESLAEELPNPGLSVTFLIEIKDVSENVLDAVSDNMGEEERSRAIAGISREIQSSATQGNHYRAQVRPFYGGNQFYLFLYEVFEDVRFVGAPPSSIGKFGYDTDNWMWPRHTGDFSIFRVYTAPDGTPAEYSPENIPLRPKHFLPVSLDGYDLGDFAMVMGNSGGTQRYMTSYEIDEQLGIVHPNRIKIRGARQEILWADMLADEEVRIKYSSKYSGSSNYWKFSIGQSQGLKRLEIKKKKETLENDFSEWLTGNPSAEAKYGQALDLIRSSVEGRKDYLHSSQYISECFLRGSEIIAFTYSQNGLVEALQGDDEEAIKLEAENSRAALESFLKNYNQPSDRKVTVEMLRIFSDDVNKKYWPDYLSELNDKYKGDWVKVTEVLFDESICGNDDAYRSFLDKPDPKAIEKDPLFLLAGSIRSVYSGLRNSQSEYNADFSRGHRLFVAGLLEMKKDEIMYPDANSTMRLTYGKVGDYKPRDGVRYRHFTTLKGVMEKEDPENFEFLVDDKLKQLYAEKDYGRYGDDGSMPVCFITDNDITGGNSGSPVINGEGEIIGLAFDGNWEAMSGDIVFEKQLQKCINVDIRYVLFIIDKYAGAQNIIDELKIQ